MVYLKRKASGPGIGLVLVLIVLCLPVRSYALLPCQCLEDRALVLTNPLTVGEDVAQLQERLQELGFYQGGIDGIYGEKVAGAVARFQASKFLEPDGEVGVETWESLGERSLSVAISKSPPPEGEMSIVVNTYNRTLTLYVNGRAFKTYPIAIGKPSTKSPVGEWAIIQKSKDWGGGFGTRWLGLNVPWGIYGIHGTNKPWMIGSAASHGCIRMHNRHVEELYNWVPLKTRVKVIGQRLPIEVNNPLKPGQTGLSVMQLQDNLEKAGFQSGFKDGRYGQVTERAVRELEAQFGLEIDGQADLNVLYLLELPDKGEEG